MRINSPVSNVEYRLTEGKTIVSMTDLKGRITYANPYFIEVSGFTKEELIGAITEISNSSSKISDIVGIINGIASQTNLLALNAAVEAARAGEAGRGFAVVATEVRSLAQRCAAAASEIKQLIDVSAEKVKAGSALASDAGATMQDIIASVNRVTGIMGEVSAASVEQSAGIGEVNQAVTQMDEVTQKNAELVEQAARATSGLEQSATTLMEALAIFKLKGKLGAAGSADRTGAGSGHKMSRRAA